MCSVCYYYGYGFLGGNSGGRGCGTAGLAWPGLARQKKKITKAVGGSEARWTGQRRDWVRGITLCQPGGTRPGLAKQARPNNQRARSGLMDEARRRVGGEKMGGGGGE